MNPSFLPLLLFLLFSPINGDSLIPFGADQQFLATNFDRDAIESTINEHSTLSSIDNSDNNHAAVQRAYSTMHRSILDTPTSEWMSTTTTESSHEPQNQESNDQPSLESSQQLEQVGEKPKDDFVLLFSHAIEIPLARTPQSIIDTSNSNQVSSSSLRHTSLSTSESDNGRGQNGHGQSGRGQRQDSNESKQDINSQKAQMVQPEYKKKYQDVPVIFHSISAENNGPMSDPYVREASHQNPSQPLVRMYSYNLAPSESAPEGQNQYQHYIPLSSYRPESVESSPVYERPAQKYQQSENNNVQQQSPRERPVKAVVPKMADVPVGYRSTKFVPLPASYRSPVLPFFPSLSSQSAPQSLVQQFGMPRPSVFKSLQQQSANNVLPQFFHQQQQQLQQSQSQQQLTNHGNNLNDNNLNLLNPESQSSSPIRSLSLFPRLIQLHQLLGGRRWF